MKKHILVVTLICFSFMLHGQISITMNDAVSTALRFANREYRDTDDGMSRGCSHKLLSEDNRRIFVTVRMLL